MDRFRAQSSTLFEAPKENNLNATNNSSSIENAPLIPLQRTITNNNEEANAMMTEDNENKTNNRSHDLLQSNESPSTNAVPNDTGDSTDTPSRFTITEYSRKH